MSTTYIGLYVVLLASLCKFLGIEVGNDALTTFVEVAMTLIGGIIAARGRYNMGGVKWHGMRKA